MSRLDGIDFAAGLGSARGGGLFQLDDCDPAAVAFGGGAEGAGLAFGGGEGYGCGGALYPGGGPGGGLGPNLFTRGWGIVGSGIVTQPLGSRPLVAELINYIGEIFHMYILAILISYT